MTDGRIYISDKTAESFGGRERVEQIFERVGSSGHVVVFGPQDTEQEVEALFWQAKRGSVGFFTRVSQDDMDNVLRMARAPTIPMLMLYDLDRNGRYDVSSFKDSPELFDTVAALLPGNRSTVREFLFAHEVGHSDGSRPTNFWDRWRGETEADQDAFRGLGGKATREFQEGILAARAGNTLGEMIITQELKNSARSSYDTLVDNPDFIHATVLGTFLEGEHRFEVTEQSLNTAIDDYRQKVFERMYDTQLARTPGFRLDISEISASDVNYSYADSFRALVAEQSPEIARRYEQFTSNMNDLDARQTALWEQYGKLSDTQQAEKDAVYRQIQGAQEELKVELQQGLNFMREANPALYRELIVSEYFGLFNSQTGMVDLERGERTPQQFFADIQRNMYETVRQLRAEGAFANDPIQKRLSDYIERDAQLRPELYTRPAAAPAEGGPQHGTVQSAPVRP